MKWIASCLVVGLFLVSLLAHSTGCVSGAIATAFVSAPNGGRDTVDPDRPLPAIYDSLGQVEVPGPPPATLAYWVLEPGPAIITAVPDDADHPILDARPGWRFAESKQREDTADWRIERGPIDSATPPGAIVLLMHGWASNVRTTDTLWQISATLADAGCRVILPDLRGHGDSTGQIVTSGFREVEDLSVLLDHIHALYPDDITLPIGVAGHSYGGGMAIQFAAHDARVRRVLALAPLADVRPSMLPGVRFFAKRFRPISWFFYLNWAIDQKAIDEAQLKMEERTGADLSVNNAVYQVARLDIPVLILQGGEDPATPLDGAQRLLEANPAAVELIVYPDAGHTSFMRDDFDDIEPRLRSWVEGLVASGPR